MSKGCEDLCQKRWRTMAFSRVSTVDSVIPSSCEMKYEPAFKPLQGNLAFIALWSHQPGFGASTPTTGHQTLPWRGCDDHRAEEALPNSQGRPRAPHHQTVPSGRPAQRGKTRQASVQKQPSHQKHSAQTGYTGLVPSKNGCS